MSASPINPKDITRIGHYEILDCIGHGGMGLVYRARDSRLDREVAIKCLRTELFEKHYRERFRREALLLAKLNHPNIVQIYDYIETDEQLALVMEFVDGQNLQTRVREQVVPIAQRMQWLIQIAHGLAVAHDSGIIHRDLKAENILINKRNLAKISDLGIAKSQDFNATLTDHVAGSYCSMSPEQAMGEELNFKSDLFSLGILAYQLLCGSHPFGNTDNKLQLMQRIISHPPIPPTKNNPHLPAEICALLGQLLSKNIDNRPDNTHWVAAQFENLCHLVVENSFESDDTQLVPAASAASATKSRASKTKPTEHPTFETKGADTSLGSDSFGTFLRAHKAIISGFFLILVIALLVTLWQLQPKPPKYVAVIPPQLSAMGMHESQQDLVKGVVYDAIQQSIIQLSDHYLVPRSEIVDVNGDVETVRLATAADELITVRIQCKTESCSVFLSRLTPEIGDQKNRLRVLATRKVDILTDNYISVAEIIQKNISSFYQEKIENTFAKVTEKDYAAFIQANEQYLGKGASKELLENLDGLAVASRHLSAIQTLYRDISLDLYYETDDAEYLEKLKNYIASTPVNNQNEQISHLLNLYHLSIATRDFTELSNIIIDLEKLDISDTKAIELNAVAALRKGEYKTAAALFEQAIKIRPSANFYHNLALCYWSLGEIDKAIESLNKAIAISPSHHKLHRLLGTIFLYKGDLQGAIASFEKILTLRDDDAISMMNLGLCYLLNKDYEKAITVFLDAQAVAPEYKALTLNLADAYNLSGRKESSVALYRQISMENDPDNYINELRIKAQALAHLGELSAAILTLHELQKNDPEGVDTKYSSALIHALAGDKVSAIVNTESALRDGLNYLWFNFPWFDVLCDSTKFESLMAQYGNPERCSQHIEPGDKSLSGDAAY